jgi:hypothetical protein
MIGSPSRAPRWATTVAVALGLAACAGPAERLLSLAVATLPEVRSGVLDLRLTVTSTSRPLVGYRSHGPFALGAEVAADLRYTKRRGTARADVRYVAVGGRAFVVADGAFYELPATPEAFAVQAPTALRDLAFDGWAKAPRVLDHREPRLITVVSALHLPAVLGGIAELLETLELGSGAGPDAITLGGADAVARPLPGGTMVVRIGSDGYLRQLVVSMDLRLGTLPGEGVQGEGVQGEAARLVFSVEIARPNEPVRIRLARIARQGAAGTDG